MSAYWGAFTLTPIRHPASESPDRPELPSPFTCATHIRGRVIPPSRPHTKGYAHYHYEVYNMRTGRVLASSDAFGFPDAVRQCAQAVFIARGARFWSLHEEDLR